MIRLRFADADAEVVVPAGVAIEGAADRIVASVDGWGGGRVFIATWRERVVRLKLVPYGMAVWGDSVPLATGRVDRADVMVELSSLKAGFEVDIGGVPLRVSRPSYGLSKPSRQIYLEFDGVTWTYRAAWPLRTELVRADGQVCARFYQWGTDVDPDISEVEMVAVLTVIGQCLWARVVSLPVMSLTWNGWPRGDGGRHVV